MALQAGHRTLYAQFLFIVIIDGFESAGFMSAEGLKYTFDKMEYREGGSYAAQKESGLVNFDDLSLERGMSQDEDFYKWVQDCVNMQLKYPYGSGKPSPGYKRDLVIQQLERDRTPVVDFDVSQAFPIEWSPGKWDNSSSEFTIDMLTLTYFSFNRVALGQPNP